MDLERAASDRQIGGTPGIMLSDDLTDIACMRSRIMYIEDKSEGLSGPARIGRVSFSKTGRTLYYAGRRFQSLKGAGFKANCYDIDSGDHFWMSGPRRDGADRLYGEPVPVEIDDDVRDECWTEIRAQARRADDRIANR